MATKSRNQSKSSKTKRRISTFFMFASPWLAGLILLGIIPLLFGIVISLTNYDGTNMESLKLAGGNGLGNYVRVFQDPGASTSFKQTMLWGSLNLPIWMGVSFILALILNQDVKGKGFFRTLYYIPSVIPAVGAVSAWKILLGQNNGLFNEIISIFQPGTAIGWLTTYSLQSLTMVAVWSGVGSAMIIFLAGLQNIPDELVDAAKIDGANNWQVVHHITLPLMTPVIFFVLIQGLIGAFQQLVFPLILARENQLAPPKGIFLYMIYVYQQIFQAQRFGYGTALLWAITIAAAAIILFVFWSQKFWVYQGDTTPTGEE